MVVSTAGSAGDVGHAVQVMLANVSDPVWEQQAAKVLKGPTPNSYLCPCHRVSTQHRELELKVSSYQLSTMFTEGGEGRKPVGGVYSMGESWQGFMTLCWLLIFSSEESWLCVHVYPHLCICVSVGTFIYPLCMCDLSDTHPLCERHITLQMTLLDGDGPFNYSTLMQSAVNTLNQAAEEEAAYPSPSPRSRYNSLLLTLTLCFSSLVLFLLFLHRHHGLTRFCHRCLTARRHAPNSKQHWL